MLSLTGYGVATANVGLSRLRVELRAVNHRFIDLKVRLPPVLSPFAAIVEDLLRQRLERGRIELTVRVEGGDLGRGALDVERARSAFHALGALRDELAPGEALPLSLLAVVPDLFSDAATPSDPAEAERALTTAVAEACRALHVMRVAEGDRLARDFEARLTVVESLVAQVQPLVTRMVEAHRDRLRARIAGLLDNAAVLDPGRLEHEVAVFADRTDVSEELTRLESHCSQLRALLRTDGAVGRKIEFLLQEIGREVNTTGAKATDLDATRLVLEMKAELERMREQVQNVL